MGLSRKSFGGNPLKKTYNAARDIVNNPIINPNSLVGSGIEDLTGLSYEDQLKIGAVGGAGVWVAGAAGGTAAGTAGTAAGTAAGASPWLVPAVVGGSLLSGYLGYKGAKDAADTSAEASRYSAQLQYDQYLQNRQDLSSYRDVATGKPIYDEYGIVTGYEGGALNTLADYGRSKVSEGDYIPASNIPEYQRSTIGLDPNISGSIPQFDVNGAINPAVNPWDVTGQVSDFGAGSRQQQYQGQNFDITNDPSYKFRQAEQEKAINRNMAGMGKLTSGNRLEEIMKRSGEMASQEYAAADARNVRDFGLSAGVNRENYGRNVGEFGLTRGVEDTRFNRGLTGYDALTAQNERLYGRATDKYGRGLTAYDAARQNEQQQYGRDIGNYQRGYAQNIDQYGRDLTAYNADTQREQQLYGRGVDAFGRASAQEGDYLNRLASLSNIGQTAATNTGQFGAAAAANQGNALVAAGNAQAAGQIGQASAIQQGLGDITSLGTQYMMNQQRQNYTTAPGYGGTGISGWDLYG